MTKTNEILAAIPAMAVTDAMVHAYKHSFSEYMDKSARGHIEPPTPDVGFNATKYALGVAFATATQQAVAVKGLEWKESAYRHTTFVASNGFGENYVAYKTDGGWRCAGSDHATLEAAKAAAQSDYEGRIRSALAPAPQAVPDTREFWLHYDHQVGKWCVGNEPPKVIRTGAEIIHTREVLPAMEAEAVKTLDERMIAAGMIPLSKLLSGDTPLGKWEAHTGIRTLAHFEEWLLRRHTEFMRMRAAYVLGDKDEADELYEWVLAHSGALSEVVANFRAATASPPKPEGIVEALREADAAIAEYIRYLDGGEMRGSYDGKPERNALRKAGIATRKALAASNSGSGR
ncbi:hypothetical protein [Mesorhizobium sp.]|uniref:hypothetical protein n=1 Tax=Mesorhizobium sp. TaxID=1871066 RepID=UPI0011F612A0|nr:hypothetical protein [Mesorhizobium sp.]TIN80749.1 MAG: hypothetical protein E5Y09_02700 [Mesorhizobium sp.]